MWSISSNLSSFDCMYGYSLTLAYDDLLTLFTKGVRDTGVGQIFFHLNDDKI